MTQPHYFRPWFDNKKIITGILLLLVLLCALISFGLFGLNQQYVLSYFGAQPEDIGFSLQLTYVGIITMLTIVFRFLQYFQRRSYIIVVILTGMVLSIADYFAKDLFSFMVLRLLTGFQTVAMATSILTLFLAMVPPPATMLVTFTIFYGAVLSNTVIIGLFFSWITDHMDWQEIYRYLFLFQAGSLGIILILLRRESGQKKYPLYQIDWTSAIFWLMGAVAFAYTLIYGSKYYWFSDNRIVTSTLIAAGSFLLLGSRQYRLKRPYWHPAVFKNRNFIIGLILLFIYYTIKDSINLIYAYCFNIVRWDTFHVMLLGSVNLLGIVSFMIIALRLLMKKLLSFRFFFILGFGLLLTYHLWMYTIFTPDLSFKNLFLPVFLQGAASGFLFVPIMLYAISGLPPYTGFTGSAIAAVTRFTSTLVSFATFYLLQLFFNQLNKESFLGHITQMNTNFNERMNQFTQLFLSRGFSGGQADALASANISRALTVQSQLLTDMHVFKAMAVVSFVVLIIIGIAPLFQLLIRNHNPPPIAHQKP